MKKIELCEKYKLVFEYRGQRVSIIRRYIGTFMVLSDLDCTQEPLPEISDNESRVIGSTVPRIELYLAIASMIAEEQSYEIKSFQILEDEDKAIFLIA